MRHHISALFLAVACLAQAKAAAPSPITPEQVFSEYVEAVNASDMARVSALISDQVERSDYPGCKPAMSNKVCLETYIQNTVVGVEGRIKTLGTEVRGDTIHASLEVRSNTAKGFGLERIVGTDVVQVTGGKITAFHFVPRFADEQTATFFGKLGIGPRAAKP